MNPFHLGFQPQKESRSFHMAASDTEKTSKTFCIRSFFCVSGFCDIFTFIWGLVSLQESYGCLVPIGLPWIQVVTILVTGAAFGFFFLDLDICQKIVEDAAETGKLTGESTETEDDEGNKGCKWCGWCSERCGESRYCKCTKRCEESRLCGWYAWCRVLGFEFHLMREAGISVLLQVYAALAIGGLFCIFVLSKLGELAVLAQEDSDVYGNLRGLCIYMPFLALGKFFAGTIMYWKALRKYYPIC